MGNVNDRATRGPLQRRKEQWQIEVPNLARLTLSSAAERVPPDRLPELMDAHDCDRRELAHALATLGRVNRHLGGGRLARRQVQRLLVGRRPGALQVLDVGAGGGDIAVTLLGNLRRAGWSPSFILADRHETTLQLCRDRILRHSRSDRRAPKDRHDRRDAGTVFSFVRVDGAELPFADGAVDIALSTTTLHHFGDAAARSFLAELARVSRIGWAVTDLRRSRGSYALMRALGETIWRRRRLTRADAPVSVLRSFTPSEASCLAAEAGCPGAVLERTPLRWALRGASA